MIDTSMIADADPKRFDDREEAKMFLLDPPVTGSPICSFMIRFIVTLVIAAVVSAPLAFGHDPSGGGGGAHHAHGGSHHLSHHGVAEAAGLLEHDCGHEEGGPGTAPCESRAGHCASAFLGADCSISLYVPLDINPMIPANDFSLKTFGPESETPPPRG